MKKKIVGLSQRIAILLIGTVLGGFGGYLSLSAQTSVSCDEQQLFIGDSIAIAQTQYGRVRGYIQGNIYTFCGIPYGDNTAGENRFMPPRPPKPWEGILPTVFWGDSAPQEEARYTDQYLSFRDRWSFYGVSEDCLRLNVWTPGLSDNQKRPVLVWLHGGSYVSGNGIEVDSYKGENLSRYGDIVFVSINHRLGPFGFINFSGADKEKFKDSGNIGVLDMVAALEWVHNNIREFGGDPNNVTIMGQSGGGSKVCTLVAMPEIRGLVHKGVALSGSSYAGGNSGTAVTFGNYLLKEAGLKPNEMHKLQEMPWKDYLELANSAMEKFNKEQAAKGLGGTGYHPMADGTHIPEGIYYSDKTAPSNNIPMIYCSTTCESSPSKMNPEMEAINLEQLVVEVAKRYGDRARKIVDAYHKAFPNKKPVELLGQIQWNTRGNTIRSINAKSVQSAPVYLAWFDWNTPLFNSRMRAFHTSDICFWFRNTDNMATHTGGGKRPRDLSIKMADALLNFMRNGNPNCGSMPEWHAYTPENGATMMLNDKCEVLKDPDREARKGFE